MQLQKSISTLKNQIIDLREDVGFLEKKTGAEKTMNGIATLENQINEIKEAIAFLERHVGKGTRPLEIDMPNVVEKNVQGDR